jgi:hypothetical protein
MRDSHELMHRSHRTPLPFSAGLLPGLQAGALMLWMLMSLAFGRQRSPVEPLVQIAAFAHRGALSATLPAAMLGLALHFGTAMLLGGLFARVVGRTGRVRQLGLGLAYGLYAWGLVQFLVLPLLHPPDVWRIGTVATFLVGHLAYGLMLGATVPCSVDIDDEQAVRADRQVS